MRKGCCWLGLKTMLSKIASDENRPRLLNQVFSFNISVLNSCTYVLL